MRALCLAETGDISCARLDDVPLPVPGPGEVRVRIRSAAVNYRDIWICKGAYPGLRLPATLGADGAGVIDAVGDGVDAAAIGRDVMIYPGIGWGNNQRVPAHDFALLGMPGPGTISEAVCVPAGHVVAKPAFLSFDEAASIPLAGVTAWRALFCKGGLEASEHLLVTGAGGGVGAFAVAFGVACGAKVYVTSGTEAGLEEAYAKGAHGGVSYKSPDWGQALLAMSGGVDVVCDAAPAINSGEYLPAVNRGGRIILYGRTGGPEFPVRAPDLYLKNIAIIGTNVGSLEDFSSMIDMVVAHAIRPAIDEVFPLDDAPAALARLEHHHGFGKVVVRVSE